VSLERRLVVVPASDVGENQPRWWCSSAEEAEAMLDSADGLPSVSSDPANDWCELHLESREMYERLCLGARITHAIVMKAAS
jgi:hypothetical protein